MNYDPERDGNIYRWILRTAQDVREQTMLRKRRDRFTAEERGSMRELDHQLEDLDKARFAKLREAQRERRATAKEAKAKSR